MSVVHYIASAHPLPAACGVPFDRVRSATSFAWRVTCKRCWAKLRAAQDARARLGIAKPVWP